MGGSQGEMAHIDLINGSEVLRVLIDYRSSFGDSYGDIYFIIVGRCTEDVRGIRPIIWNNRLEILSEIKLDKISNSFYTTLDEERRMSELRWIRWRNYQCSDRKELGDAYKSVALRWLRRQPRMKTCKL